MNDETTPGPDLRERITRALAVEQDRRARPGTLTSPEIYRAALADTVMAVVQPVIERLRSNVEAAPATAIWTGRCVECGDPIKDGGQITWRLAWSPQGPIHEECR